MSNVVHIKKDNYDIYIGRKNGELGQSIWANPFTVEEYGRDECINKYEEYLRRTPTLLDKLPSLTGKVLGCWCSPKKCHGHILAKYAHKEEDKLRLVISGSRSLENNPRVRDIIKEQIVNTYLSTGKRVIIIEGGARGVDRIANSVARELNLEHLTIPTIWKNEDGTTNRGAGMMRNRTMLKLADAVLCVWDGKSPGTKHMYNSCIKESVRVRLISIT